MDALLQPIVDTPFAVGKDFRQFEDADSPYLELKDWRAAARRLEREAASSEDPTASPFGAAIGQWEDIASVSDKVLKTQSKDLEVASWYCEALVRLASLGGLAAGLELLARLVEDYWDGGLYPQEDEDGVDTRLAPLAGLIGRGVASSLVQPIKLAPLSDRADLDPVALWNFELAFAPPRGETSEGAEKRNTETAALLATLRTASPAFLRRTRKDVALAQENLARLMRVVDEKTQVGGFASQVSACLEAIASLLDDYVGHLLVETDAGAAESSDVGVAAGATDPPASHERPVRRDEALRSLERAAEYFETAEPQALIAQSIRDVVRRARLPMMELLLELVPDEMQRNEFLMRAGIKSPGV